MSAQTCFSCARSYAVPTDDYGGSMLMCEPDGEYPQVAKIVCLKFIREPGADEPEGDIMEL